MSTQDIEAMNTQVIKALRATTQKVTDCFLTTSPYKASLNNSTTSSVYATSTQLVAVSKTKPVHLLKACYNSGQRHFGENYVQEIIEKVSQMPTNTKWHFIGPIQSNKVNNLINKTWPHLHMVETVGTMKLANKLETAVGRIVADPSLANRLPQMQSLESSLDRSLSFL